jgi:predicted TIM-barrel fold metal-dependent hydrolase
MSDYKIYSADSHVSEPGDLWVERIDAEYRFRAPRLEARERNGKMEDLWIYEGWPPHPVGVGLGAADRNGPGNSSFRAEGKGYGDALAGGWDPAARLKDQDVDGVEGEVLYTTLGFRLFWIADEGLQRACFRVYNDWLAEFCSYAPDRLVGLALISLYDVDEAILELRRAAKQGHRGAMIFLSPPAGYPSYSTKAYDRFWAEAQELDMAMVLHENTGGAESRTSPSSYWDPDLTLGVTITRPHEVQRSLGGMILSGVFERFPRLRMITAENGTDWLPWFLGRLKRKPRATSYPTPLTMLPIEYWYRNCFATYINEQDAVEHRDIIGVDNLMFATDYPHSASTWPKSEEIVARDMADVSEADRRKLIHDNTLRAFGIRAAVAV